MNGDSFGGPLLRLSFLVGIFECVASVLVCLAVAEDRGVEVSLLCDGAFCGFVEVFTDGRGWDLARLKVCGLTAICSCGPLLMNCGSEMVSAMQGPDLAQTEPRITLHLTSDGRERI